MKNTLSMEELLAIASRFNKLTESVNAWSEMTELSDKQLDEMSGLITDCLEDQSKLINLFYRAIVLNGGDLVKPIVVN